MKKAALLLLVLASLGIAACGDSEDETPSKTTPTETTEAAGGGSGQAAGGGGTLSLEAAGDSELAYTTDAASVAAGAVTVEFTNPQTLTHDVVIESSQGEDVGRTDLIADSSTTATVDLKPGAYKFYCSVPGHREAGMEGDLTVK